MKTSEMNNLPILGVALQLIGEVALNVVGNEIASEVDGVKITQSSVPVLAAASLNKVLTEKSRA